MILEIVPLVEKLKSRVNTNRISLDFPSADSIIVVPSSDDTFPLSVSFSNNNYLVSAAKFNAFT
jgi:hypothetical protein